MCEIHLHGNDFGDVMDCMTVWWFNSWLKSHCSILIFLLRPSADIPLLKEAWSLPACYQHQQQSLSFPISHCWPGLTLAVNPLPPDSPQQPAEKWLELRPFPMQPLLPLLPMQSKANNQYSLHHKQWWSTTGPSNWIKLKTSQANTVVPAQHKSCRSYVYE